MIPDRSQESEDIQIRHVASVQELLFCRSPLLPAPAPLHPLLLWVGIGCNQGISRQMIEAAIEQVFRENQLAESAIAGIATIDVKIDEVGLIEFCLERNLPIKTFSSEILRSVCVPNPSKAVEKEVGTFSVAEAAALCAAQCQNLLVRKQIFRSSIPNQKGAVTIAIAQQQLVCQPKIDGLGQAGEAGEASGAGGERDFSWCY